MGVLVLALGFVLKPSLSSPAESLLAPVLPSAAELAQAKGFARLLENEDAFHAMREVDLSQALKAVRARRQFELLPETSIAARRSVLRRLPCHARHRSPCSGTGGAGWQGPLVLVYLSWLYPPCCSNASRTISGVTGTRSKRKLIAS